MVWRFGSKERTNAPLRRQYTVFHPSEVQLDKTTKTVLNEVEHLKIHRLIASGAAVTPEKRLVPGDLVEIRSGPLAGLRGTILKSASGSRFVVQVDFIQRGASVLLDDFTLARIDQCSPSY